MCSWAHMDSRGNPARSHKRGIKTAGGRLEGLRAERANLSGADTQGFEEIASLGSIQAGSSDHDVIEYHAIGRAAQLLEKFRRSKPSGDGGKHIQLGLLIFF
jgi:hypothetical protein